MGASYSYRTFQDLTLIIRKNIHRLPSDLDLIVGIPRSGMIPAYMIALFMNKKACSLDEFLDGIKPSHGERDIGEESSEIQKVLIVDDSINTGNAQLLLRKRLNSFNLNNVKIYTCAIYASSYNSDMVDFYFEVVKVPRFFEWNYLNIKLCNKWCYDIDGVLCKDPTPEENDDGIKYRDFLLNAEPLYIPQHEIYALVTSRLEKYRSETEDWLKKHNVKYQHLFMLNLPSAEERRKLKLHAAYKAEVYRQLPDATLFVESEEHQAEQIASLSNKPAIAVETNRLFINSNEKPTNVICDKDVLSISPKEYSYKANEPIVSVIMPVYNVAEYLQQALDTVRGQTLENIEIICVDDGSTDNSCKIIENNIVVDKRIKLIKQENKRAGVARNTGLDIARGKYIIFLDPDDFFMPNMLEKTVEKLELSTADMCVFDVYYFDNQSGSLTHPNEVLRKDYLIEKNPFNYKDNSSRIFNITTGAPWNKIYRRDFVIKNNLKFQDTINTNDLFFVASSLVKADSIFILNECLMYYRINVSSSLQYRKKDAPLEFEKAFTALKNEICAMGIYDTVKQSFVNRAVSSCIHNLKTTHSFEAFKLVHCKLRDEILEKYDIKDKSIDYYYYRKNYYTIQEILKLDSVELWNRLHKPEKNNITKEKQELDRIKNSRSYKLGLAITFIPRKIKSAIQCYKDNGLKYTIKKLLFRLGIIKKR